MLRETRVIERVRLPDSEWTAAILVSPGSLRTLPDGTREVDWQVALALFLG